MKSDNTAGGRPTRRLPVLRVVPRIAYFQGRYTSAGTLVRRLAVVGAEHLIEADLATDEERHGKVGAHTFVMRPAGYQGGNPKQLRLRLSSVYGRLGLLPDWDYKHCFTAVVPDPQEGDPNHTKPVKHNAFLMVTVQRKRRERTIVLPLRLLEAADQLATLTVNLLRPNGSPLQGATLQVGVRVGGVAWTKTAPGSSQVVLSGVPKSRFVVQIDSATLPDGLAPPRRGQRMVDLTAGDLTVDIKMRKAT